MANQRSWIPAGRPNEFAGIHQSIRSQPFLEEENA